MNNLQIVLIVIGWLLIGYLIGLLKIKGWKSLVIKQKSGKLKKFWLYLLWPSQTTASILFREEYKEFEKDILTILPISSRGITLWDNEIQESISVAFQNNSDQRLGVYKGGHFHSSCLGYQDFDQESFLDGNYFSMILLGPINIVLWAIGIARSIVISTIALIAVIVNGAIHLGTRKIAKRS